MLIVQYLSACSAPQLYISTNAKIAFCLCKSTNKAYHIYLMVEDIQYFYPYKELNQGLIKITEQKPEATIPRSLWFTRETLLNVF